MMEIRKSTEADVPRMMELYRSARQFMAEHGNPNQWGPTNWPPEDLIHQDIAAGNSYVCTENGWVVGTFYFIQGKDIEPTYAHIEDGKWEDPRPYGVIHRLAGDHSVKGVGAFCLTWAFDQCGHLRVDTHGDNVVVQNLLMKLGFERRGIIYVIEDDYPRIAYERSK